MKFVLGTIFVLVLGMLAYGFYLKNLGDFDGEILIGIAVLVIAFILMPLFIFHRYKNKDLSSFKLRNFSKDEQEKK